MFFVAIIVFAVLYGMVNYYVGLKLWQILKQFITCAYLYWLVFFAMAFSYVLGTIGEKYIPSNLFSGIIMVGSYWLAALIYLLIFFGIYDFFHLVFKFKKFNTAGIYLANIYIFAATIFLIILGSFNARNAQISHYDIYIDKSAGGVSKLHAVMVSDIHLGNIVGKARLNKMITQINALHPDIIFFAGDMIDDDVKPFVNEKMAEDFSKLHSKYGTYGVMGNHEYISGNPKEIAYYYEKAGIKLLRDTAIKINNSFYIVGREDLSAQRFGNKKRKDLEDIIKNENKSLPIILMDHQPSTLNESMKNGVDLQLSGHTHGGQLFPFNLITKAIFEKDWGYLKNNNLNLIVSCGYGTWGPPVRIGTRSEIVDITIHFTK